MNFVESFCGIVLITQNQYLYYLSVVQNDVLPMEKARMIQMNIFQF